MRIILIIILFTNLLVAGEIKLNLMPWPKKMEIGKGLFKVDSSFSIASNRRSTRVDWGANRILQRISNRTGIFLKNPYLREDGDSKIKIEFNNSPKLDVSNDDSYFLKITNNSILLKAESDLGIINGLETLNQLLSVKDNQYVLPVIEITDSPRFAWRGLMIDAARHFMPIDILKRNIDGMSAVKLNILHLHLSDDQGFRVESDIFPELHSNNLDGNYYSKAQIKDLISYADLRGIRIIPEFDIPAHATSWLHVFPEIGSSREPYLAQDKWGVFNSTFDPSNDSTYKFFEKFLDEMTNLFPDKYFHIGGDENTGKEWDSNDDIREYKLAKGMDSNHNLQIHFINKIHKMIMANDKIMIGWDEILDDKMDRSVVIQAWRNKEIYRQSIEKGFMTILSNDYYLDLMYSTDSHYNNDPLDPALELNSEESAFVLGGEAPMWSELVTPENIDSRIWPRTASIAEKFWSPSEVSSIDFMYERLDFISFLLEEHGLTHRTFQSKMLRRLSNNQSIESLKILVDAVKPLEEYGRLIDGKKKGISFGQVSPNTRMMDAAISDSKVGREFSRNVERFFKTRDAADLDVILFQLKVWAANHTKLLPIIMLSPILIEIKPLSYNLSRIAELAITKLNHKNENPNKKLILSPCELNNIEEARISYGQLKIIVLESILKLIEE